MPKISFRAPLHLRLHFLFTGVIPNYWYNAQTDVMTSYLQYYLEKLKDKNISEEARERYEKCIDVFATHRFNKNQIQEFIPRNQRLTDFQPTCMPGILYFDFFDKSWTKQKRHHTKNDTTAPTSKNQPLQSLEKKTTTL